MSAMDKLIDLLEKLKQENPEFHDKAGKALDVLIDDDEEVGAFEPEEEFDDSYVELEKEEYEKILLIREKTTNLVLQLGLTTQNYEDKKCTILEKIDTSQQNLINYVENLKLQKRCDQESDYELLFPENGKTAAFRKI